MLFHDLLLHIIYLFTHPSPPLTHGIFNRALYPTGLAHRCHPDNTHDFELKIGSSPQISHSGVCSGWVSLAAVSKAYFFNCWELIEVYLLDIGQMTPALQVNGKTVISHILKLPYFMGIHSRAAHNCSEKKKMFFLILSVLAVRDCLRTWGEWVLSFRPCQPSPQPATPGRGQSPLWEHRPLHPHLLLSWHRPAWASFLGLYVLPTSLYVRVSYLFRSLSSPCKIIIFIEQSHSGDSINIFRFLKIKLLLFLWM